MNAIRISTRALAATAAVLLAAPLFAQSAPAPGAPPANQQDGANGNRGGNGNAGGQGRGQGQGRGGMGGQMGRMFGGGGGGMGGGGGAGMRDVRDALEPDFARRDLQLFVRQLTLDEVQGDVVEQLFEDYETAYQPEMERVQSSMMDVGRRLMESFMTPERQEQMTARMEKMREELRAAEENGEMTDEQRRDFFRTRMEQSAAEAQKELAATGIDAEIKSAFTTILADLEALQTKKLELKKSFIDGVKATLDDAQMVNWDPFERFLTREKTLPRGRISGESTNLFLVVDDARLPVEEFAKVEPLFDSYESQLDAALRARNDFITESNSRLFKAMVNGDTDGASRIIKQQVQLRTAVRDVNESFRTQMVGALGETAVSQQLNQSILASAFERVYGPTQTTRMFEAAKKLDGLDAAVLASIGELELGYANEVRPLNDRLYTLTKQSEPDELVAASERAVTMLSSGIGGMMGGMGRGMGGQRNDTTREVNDQKRKVGENYQEKLKALLTPDQLALMPQQGRGGRGGQGGQGGQGGFGGAAGVTRMLERLPEEQRKEIIGRLDTNKNGTIDEDEATAARDMMRQQFGGGRGGQGGQPGQGGNGGRRGQGGQPPANGEV